MPLLPAEILNKRYRIVSLLGSGAYGAVYRSWDQTAGVSVALKEYHDPSVDTQRLFRAQARKLSGLKHDQLPVVLDHFALTERGQYLVSEYIEGVNLATMLAHYGPLPSDLVIVWLQAVCRPLLFMHEHDQLHLDIKPANIVVSPQDEVYLVDSGLPGLGVRPHTKGLGSPEQQNQGEVSATSDIYSLGATLYILLTGETPPGALGRESGLHDLIPAREVNPNVEPYLSLVAQRAMSLRDDSRYASVADFATALNRPSGHTAPVLQGDRRTVEWQATAPPPRLPQSRRRQMQRRSIAGLSALLVIIVVAMAAFAALNITGDASNEISATETVESAVVAALTAIAPTATPIPPPTAEPTSTPRPLITKTGSRMLLVNDGVFLMGDDEADERNRQPSHLVRVDAFYMDETEVTNGAYAQCVEAAACSAPDSPNATYHDGYYGNPSFDEFPVLFVSWSDAQSFCSWRDARLPSEAEWEKAASFDPLESVKLAYPWGQEFAGSRLNYCDLNCPRDHRDADVDDGHRDTAPVGSYADGRSPSGMYDMAGNVMEWVSDWYDPRYYEVAADTNPLGPPEGQFKTLRGGSWLSAAEETLTTARASYDPDVSRANLGFRCAAAVP